MTKIGNIRAAVVQRVGSKNNGDGVSFSEELCQMTGVEEHLLRLINASFKFDDWKHFYNIDDLKLNPVYRFVSKVFEDESSLVKQAQNLARHLYEQSIHPNIKIGEFYVVYLEQCKIDGIETDAIGLFKSESRETVLTVKMESNRLVLCPEMGMSLKKLEKGAVIFNIEKESGYKVAVVDNTSRKSDAHYWVDNFLHVEDCKDDYHQTQNLADFCSGYLKLLKEKSLVEGVIAAQKASELFLRDEIVDIDNLPILLCDTKEQIAEFKEYKETYEKEHGEMAAEINVKPKAVKRRNTSKMNVMRIGKDFEVKILKSSARLEKVEEKSGDKYYKLYYKN